MCSLHSVKLNSSDCWEEVHNESDPWILTRLLWNWLAELAVSVQQVFFPFEKTKIPVGCKTIQLVLRGFYQSHNELSSSCYIPPRRHVSQLTDEIGFGGFVRLKENLFSVIADCDDFGLPIRSLSFS